MTANADLIVKSLIQTKNGIKINVGWNRSIFCCECDNYKENAVYNLIINEKKNCYFKLQSLYIPINLFVQTT